MVRLRLIFLPPHFFILLILSLLVALYILSNPKSLLLFSPAPLSSCSSLSLECLASWYENISIHFGWQARDSFVFPWPLLWFFLFFPSYCALSVSLIFFISTIASFGTGPAFDFIECAVFCFESTWKGCTFFFSLFSILLLCYSLWVRFSSEPFGTSTFPNKWILGRTSEHFPMMLEKSLWEKSQRCCRTQDFALSPICVSRQWKSCWMVFKPITREECCGIALGRALMLLNLTSHQKHSKALLKN